MAAIPLAIPLKDDLKKGARAFGELIGKTQRNAYTILERRRFRSPFKVGSVWWFRESAVRREIEDRERGES